MGVQFVGCHRGGNGLTGEISTPSGRGPGHGISHAGRRAAMWFQVPTPQTTSRSTSSRRSILKRDESLPIAPRDWVSFDATARRSTDGTTRPNTAGGAAGESQPQGIDVPQLWADTVGGSQSKHFQVRDLLENKSSPSTARTAPAPYVLSVEPQTVHTGSPANGSHRQPPQAAHAIEISTPRAAYAIEMSTGPNVDTQNDSFMGALQSFGATLGLPLQGFSPNQEIPSNNATGGRQQMSSPLRDNSGRREFGVAAAAARELAQQTGSKPGGGDSHRDSPASMISLPASKTAKGLWPPVSPLSPIQQNTKHDIEPHHRTPNNSDMTEEESMQPQRVISVLTAIDGLQDMPANEKPPSRDVHAATPSAPIINITGQRRSSRDQGRRTLATWQMSEPVLVPSESSFQENGARPVSAHDSSRSPSANLGARAPSHGSSHAYSAGGPSILQWGNEMSLSVATGGVPRVSNEPKLSRAQKARRMMDAAQSNLEERIHPFSCADSVKNHVECREDGKLPNVRVSRDSRCPCLIFSINGGSFFRDGVASSKSVAKVVCNVSLGANSGRTLAATLEEDGSWESFTVFTFSLNIAQLHLQTQETSVPMKARQNVLAISCSILDEYGVQNVIGRVNFDLMAVLRIAAQKSDETVAYLLDDTSQHIRMPDKYGNMHRTCIYFSVDGYGLPQWISDSRAPGTNTGAWAPPSLDDFLKTVDEAAPSAVALKSVDAGAENDTREASYGSDEDNDELSPDETHWREKLERIMDSLWMSFCVMVLVLIDIVLAIVFDFRAKDGSATPTGIIVVQSFILVGFVLELFLRYVAKRRRFWSSMWNVFDLVVIFSSVVIFVAILVVAGSSEPQGLGGAKTTTTALRVASRFATALRIVRILLALRKAQQFDVTSQIRTIVSQNKRRYKKHGFDLDLTYITNRVIAMSAPAFGGHSAYRNDMHMVARFFVQQHYSRFFIFNLCDTYFSSDGVMGNYNTKLLCGQCHRIPFEDHGPPLLVEMLHLCAQASRWCKLDQDHVIAVHCKGGKGRTGVMIAAFLLWTGHRRTAMDALELFSFRRTQNWDASLGFNCDEDSEDDAKRGKRNQGVDGPSQVRYVHYMEAVVNGQVDPYAMVPTYLSEIRLSVGPQQQYAPWYCSVSIKCMRTVIFDSLDFGSLYSWTGRTGEEFSVPVGLEVWGDVRIEIFRHKSLNPKSKRKLCFFCIFNTTFYAGKRRLVLKKNKVDMLHKDKQNKLTTADFNMTLYFELSETTSVMQRAWFESVCAYIGKPSQYVKGETIIGDEDFNSESFFICTRGALEGVIHGDAQSGDHKQDHHLHGLYVPEGREAKPKKIPCSTIQGRGTLVGSYRFFLGSSGIEYRARTDIVQGYHVPRNLAGGPSQAKSVSDIRVSGVPDEKLLEFYEVMGWDAARSLLRIRTEVERLASMRAFNARTAVLNSADEKVQLISSISGQFGLPYNEEIRLCCRCSLKVSGHSGFNKNHEWLDVRCIIMNLHLLFDYAIFGPCVDICSFLLYNDEVLDVKEVSENPKNGVLVNIKTKRANLSLQIPSQSNGIKVLGLLHEAILCSKALRQRLEHHVFNAPLIRPILAAGKKEYLSSGQTFDIVTAACAYGFVYVEKGHFVLKKRGRTVAELMEGDVLGLPEFMLGLSLLGYSLQAHGNASEFILTQVSSEIVRKMRTSNTTIVGALYRASTIHMLEEARELMRGAFPGTWLHNRTQAKDAGSDKPGMSARWKS